MKKGQITIRQATTQDAPAIAEVHIKSYRKAYEGIIHQSYLDNGLDINERAQSWKKNLEQDRKGTFVAFDGDILVGFAAIGQSSNDEYKDYAELFAIYIDPDYFGNGVGKKLFQNLLQYTIAQNFHKMLVYVLRDNKIARDFYEHMGAVPIQNSEKELIIDGHRYVEIRYEWKNLLRIIERFID